LDKRSAPPVDEDDVAIQAVEVTPDEPDVQKPIHDTDQEPQQEIHPHKGPIRRPGA
jgi:hypothetical protein